MDYGLAVEGRVGQCPKRPFAAGILYRVFRSGRKKTFRTLSEGSFCGRSLSVKGRFGQCLKRPFTAERNSRHFVCLKRPSMDD